MSRMVVLSTVALTLVLPAMAAAEPLKEIDPRVRADRQERRLEEIERREGALETEAQRLDARGRVEAADRVDGRADALGELADDVRERREETLGDIVEERQERRERRVDARAERRIEERQDARGADRERAGEWRQGAAPEALAEPRANEVDPNVRASRQARRLEEIQRREAALELEAQELDALGRVEAADRIDSRADALGELGEDVAERREETLGDVVDERQDTDGMATDGMTTDSTTDTMSGTTETASTETDTDTTSDTGGRGGSDGGGRGGDSGGDSGGGGGGRD